MSYEECQLLCVTTDETIPTLPLTDLESELLQSFPNPDQSGWVATAMVYLVAKEKTLSF